MMRRWLAHTALWLAAFGCQMAVAAGTPANTVISTQATAEYHVGTTPLTLTSNAVTATVAELLNVHATWQDSTPVVVHPLDVNRVLTFRITNTGNGTETFALDGTGTVNGDQFDPIITGIYLDSNGNDLFEPGTDTLYQAGANDPVLTPDAAMTVFISSNIPGHPSDGDLGDCRFSVSARTGSGSPGDALSGLGDGGTDAIFGASGASAGAVGTYAISNTQVSVVKSATVSDLHGGTLPSTGAVISYHVQVDVNGTGTASAVVFNDPIPSHTTYRPQSLYLNGTQLSDIQDSDAGDVGASASGAVTVHLGDLAVGSETQIISFDVTID